MKIHRFYYNQSPLEHDFWFDDEMLLHQWLKVLRFAPGQQLVLFDGEREDRLYEITQLGNGAVKLRLVTELERKVPAQHVYLFFSLLKKDKNDWVLQKCTELGVRNFVPILADRSEKTGFRLERAEKIVIEAAEQCGRSDIPDVRQPLTLDTALREYQGKVSLLVAEQSAEQRSETRGQSLENNPPDSILHTLNSKNPTGVFIGPEGGWTDHEKKLLAENCQRLNLSDFTLRAETACVAAVSKLA